MKKKPAKKTKRPNRAKRKAAAPPRFRDRIKRFERVPAGKLRANPKNWRKHPAAQRDALRGALEQVGMADAVLARETAGGLELIDGHLRAELADDQIVPVLVLDVTQEEADLLLASHDALTGLAEKDQQKFNDLTASLEAITSDALRWALRQEYVPREGEEPPAGLDTSYTPPLEAVNVAMSAGEGAPPARPEEEFGYKPQFGVIVLCDNERKQRAVYNALVADGYECRVVVT